MKILYLCADPGIDVGGESGGSIHVRGLIAGMAELGHSVTVVCTHASGESTLQVPATLRAAPLAGWNRTLRGTLRIGSQSLGLAARQHPDLVRAAHNVTFLRAARDAANAEQPDFIYERYSLWSGAGALLARAFHVPLVLEVNAPLVWEQQHFRALSLPATARHVERWIWRQAEVAVVVSDQLHHHLTQAGVKEERVHTLPNAVDTAIFRPGQNAAYLRRQLGIDHAFVLGFSGTFKRWHGLDQLLAAFRQLHTADASMHLLLVGDGPLRRGMEEAVRAAGLQRAVTFAGAVRHDQMPAYLAAMDVALAPYPALPEFYYSPLKLFEYMASGCTIVASRIGQVGEILTDGHTGSLYRPESVGDLVARVRHLHGDAALRRRLGRNASDACREYTWRRNAARVVTWVEATTSDHGQETAA